MYKLNDIQYSCRRIEYLKEYGNYTQISNDVLKLTNGNEFKIYFYLRTMYNHTYQYAFPSLRTIAEETDISLPTVKRCIKTLEEKHLIKILKFEAKTSQYANNCYRLYFPIITKNNYLDNLIEEDKQNLQQTIKEIDDEVEGKIYSIEKNIDGKEDE